MSFFNNLEKNYPGRIERPTNVSDIRAGFFYVYILTIEERPIIVGHGKRNRARVIFDTYNSITPNHIKAITVRLHLLFAQHDAIYARYLIRCSSKDEAKQIETCLHREFRGNTLELPEAVQENLFLGLAEDSLARMVIRMALCSSFDGIADLKRWRRQGIIGDSVWGQINERLKIPFDL